MTALDVLRAAIAGRQVLVVGSGPLEGPLVIGTDEVVVAVNGAISSVREARVHVWMLNARSDVHTWNAQRRRLHETMLEQGANRDVAIACLLTRDDDSEAVTLKALQLRRARLGQVVTISRPERTALETRSGARQPAHRKDALSLGLFTVGLVLELGAVRARLAGFSWTAGYAYLPNDPFVQDRGHGHADQLALAYLAARHGDRLEHALELPDRLTSQAQKEIALMAGRGQGGRHNAPGASSSSSTTSTDPVKPRKVRATALTQYGGARRREGDVFVLRSPAHFKPQCMVDVPDDTPLGPAPVEGIKSSKGFRMPHLKPNAADPVDDVDDAPAGPAQRAGEVL